MNSVNAKGPVLYILMSFLTISINMNAQVIWDGRGDGYLYTYEIYGMKLNSD